MWGSTGTTCLRSCISTCIVTVSRQSWLLWPSASGPRLFRPTARHRRPPCWPSWLMSSAVVRLWSGESPSLLIVNQTTTEINPFWSLWFFDMFFFLERNHCWPVKIFLFHFLVFEKGQCTLTGVSWGTGFHQKSPCLMLLLYQYSCWKMLHCDKKQTKCSNRWYRYSMRTVMQIE